MECKEIGVWNVGEVKVEIEHRDINLGIYGER